MSYIGRQPQIGNFQICDAISVVNGQAAYTMQVSSVNVEPETANHMIVSLNGIIQAPISSYTVSGSTITFASNLVTGDVINFIQILGSVLDLGTPSDATVTDAKTNFVSTSSAAGLQIKGDGTTDGTLQLNCSQNSHGIKIKSPPHSASASYTLTMPNNDGDANQFLQTDGSGVLSFAEAGGGITHANFWRLTADLSVDTTGSAGTTITANLETIDSPGSTDLAGIIGSPMTVSSGVWTFPATGIWKLAFSLNFKSSGNAAPDAFGMIIRGTPDNSSYSTLVHNPSSNGNNSAKYGNVSGETLFDCKNTSTHKVVFNYYSTEDGQVVRGSSSFTETGFSFIRLGDT